jgi:hypothetical protein
VRRGVEGVDGASGWKVAWRRGRGGELEGGELEGGELGKGGELEEGGDGRGGVRGNEGKGGVGGSVLGVRMRMGTGEVAPEAAAWQRGVERERGGNGPGEGKRRETRKVRSRA